jgi:hypothetical protein
MAADCGDELVALEREEASVRARGTVAVRGTSRSSAISPKWSPGPSEETTSPSMHTSISPFVDEVEAVADLALARDLRPAGGRHATRLRARCSSVAGGKRREERKAAEKLELALRHAGPLVES